MYNNKLIFWIWGIINLLTGIWELYAYNNRKKLKLENITIWEKINLGQINIYNFWLEGFSEYSKVDSRYIIKHYVWLFELINAFISILFILFLISKNYELIKIILIISIINCLLYFLTLFLEIYEIKDKNIINNIKQYSKNWMLPIYYLISSIWLFVPIILLIKIGK
jgi:hypothetical protein